MKPKKNTRKTIVMQLRSDIIERRFLPGELMPTRVELMKRFDVAPLTLQAAMTQLISEGFLAVGAARHGTRIALSPPHLCHYKLVLPPQPRTKSLYYQALVEEARQRSGPGTDRFIGVFDGVRGHNDIEKYQKLVEDVSLRRLAGLLFFATSLTEYRDTPLLTAPSLPRFAIATERQLPGVPKADFDFPSFFKRAAERLAARGARRPAVLAESSVAIGWLAEPIMSTLRAFGMTTPEPWVQFVQMSSPGSIAQCVQLLFFKENGQRPDGLIIADDNLVEHATLALRSVMGPEADALPVVAHANFPSIAPSHVRASRLGVDIRALFSIALDSIDAQIKGEPTTMFQLISNVFEEEIGS